MHCLTMSNVYMCACSICVCSKYVKNRRHICALLAKLLLSMFVGAACRTDSCDTFLVLLVLLLLLLRLLQSRIKLKSQCWRIYTPNTIINYMVSVTPCYTNVYKTMHIAHWNIKRKQKT